MHHSYPAKVTQKSLYMWNSKIKTPSHTLLLPKVYARQPWPSSGREMGSIGPLIFTISQGKISGSSLVAHACGVTTQAPARHSRLCSHNSLTLCRVPREPTVPQPLGSGYFRVPFHSSPKLWDREPLLAQKHQLHLKELFLLKKLPQCLWGGENQAWVGAGICNGTLTQLTLSHEASW